MKNYIQKHLDNRTFGERIADNVAAGMGSWKFIIIQTGIVGVWIAVNILVVIFRWDPYPFILLNLLFSTQAAYAAPIIMMSQNRAAARDRAEAEADFEVNRKAEKLIAYNNKLTEDIHKLTAEINQLIKEK